MKKRVILFQILYYILFLLCYVGFALVAVRLLRSNNLGEVIFRTFLLVYVITPILIAVLSRFSLLQWYVDPFAAAIVPLFFYVGILVNETKHRASFWEAFAVTNQGLAEDGMGWFLLIGLFLFGLLATFSPARKAGKNISYRLIGKITKE